MSTAINIQRRTPEQDQAYFEAMREADYVSRRQQREISEEEFQTLYMATLHRHMLEELQPILKAKADLMSLSIDQRFILHSDGKIEWINNNAKPGCWDAIDALRKSIISRYMQGIKS